MWIRMVSRIQPDAKKGDLKFVDYDGDGTIGFGDRQYMGSATPKTTFAWTLGFYLEEIVIQCNVSRSRWSTSNECFPNICF